MVIAAVAEPYSSYWQGHRSYCIPMLASAGGHLQTTPARARMPVAVTLNLQAFSCNQCLVLASSCYMLKPQLMMKKLPKKPKIARIQLPSVLCIYISALTSIMQHLTLLVAVLSSNAWDPGGTRHRQMLSLATSNFPDTWLCGRSYTPVVEH